VIYPGDKEKGYLGDDGKSKMPNYNDILTIQQVADLAAYIASLKGEKHAGH
jgi:mono/diheme cytochrome c family protein